MKENITITNIVPFVLKMVAVVRDDGGGSQTCTWDIDHNTDRSAAGNEVVTSGTTTTSETTGDVVTSFNDATIPAASWVWLEISAETNILGQYPMPVRRTRIGTQATAGLDFIITIYG